MAMRPEEEETLERLASRLIADAEPEVKQAIAELLEDVTVESVTAALAGLRESGLFTEVVRSLAAHHPDELLDAILPGHEIDPDVDVRLWTPRKFAPDWMGDLQIKLIREGGLSVVVGSRRGARALDKLGRAGRAAFTSVSIAAREGEHRRTIEPMLARLPFDGVTALHADAEAAPVLARWILNCPSLTSFRGPITDPAVLDALATTAVRSISADRTGPESLEALVRCGWLATLYLSQLDDGFRSTGLGPLARYPALRELHVGRRDLQPAELAQVVQIRGLEELHLGSSPIDDVQGMTLAALVRLRTLDLHETRIGDRTLEALAGLPLENLDVAETAITAEGIRSLRRCTTLRELGLSWHLGPEAQVAAQALKVEVLLNDYIAGGSALWGGGYYE